MLMGLGVEVSITNNTVIVIMRCVLKIHFAFDVPHGYCVAWQSGQLLIWTVSEAFSYEYGILIKLL